MVTTLQANRQRTRWISHLRMLGFNMTPHSKGNSWQQLQATFPIDSRAAATVTNTSRQSTRELRQSYPASTKTATLSPVDSRRQSTSEIWRRWERLPITDWQMSAPAEWLSIFNNITLNATGC